MQIPVEIERKYVIEKPQLEMLKDLPGYSSSDIEQTYLESSPAVTHRVRARRYGERTVYTETKKVRIDKMSAFEDEREVSEGEYRELLLKKAEGTVTVKKTRHTFEYLTKTFEVDIYPEWQRSAILETELESRDTEVSFPAFITVMR